jgi:hypoxanthine phosphoribosyltransferase
MLTLSVLDMSPLSSTHPMQNKTQAPIEAQTPNFELLISPDEISQKIHRAAEAIDRHYAGEELTVVVLMKGALCLAADLIRALKTPCCMECIQTSSYGQRGTERGELTVTGLEKFDPTSKNVLVVDDIFDSGQTMTRVVAELKKKNPKSLQSLVLLSKKIEREVTYRPDYVLFEIEDLFVVGFGMDYKEHFRGLPGIHVFR